MDSGNHALLSWIFLLPGIVFLGQNRRQGEPGLLIAIARHADVYYLPIDDSNFWFPAE